MSGGGYLTVAQVAEDSGFSARTVLRWISDGQLVAVRFPGGRLRIRESDYAEMQTAGATTAYAVPSASGPATLSRPGPDTGGKSHA